MTLQGNIIIKVRWIVNIPLNLLIDLSFS
jgi:hypothetical protein